MLICTLMVVPGEREVSLRTRTHFTGDFPTVQIPGGCLLKYRLMIVRICWARISVRKPKNLYFTSSCRANFYSHKMLRTTEENLSAPQIHPWDRHGITGIDILVE